MTRNMKVAFWVLVISNVLLLGYIVGNSMHHAPYYKKHNHKHFKKGVMYEIMKDSKVENKALFSEMKQVREALFETLSAEEFNEELYGEQVSELHELRNKFMSNISLKIKNKAKTLSVEDRRKLARQLERMHKHRYSKQH